MRIRNILCAFLTLIAVGCAKELPTGNDISTGNAKTITVNMPALTRTAIGAETQTGVSLVWSKGDEIAIIEGKGTNAQKYSTYKLVGEGGTTSGTFEYVSGDASADVITDVVFPASAVANAYAVPTAQTYVEGSFDTDAMVMSWTRTAEAEGITLSHEASALMFTVTGAADQKISSVAVTYGEKTYTLSCTEPVALSSEGKVFYVAVPGSTVSQNYAVVFTTDSGNTLTKDFTYALNAGKIGKLPAFAFETAPAVEPLKVGDYFGGGIVFEIGDGYAKVVSLDESICKWAIGDGETTRIGTESGPVEGINNTDLFRNRADLQNFPAAAWCIEKGDGWYMPSREEMNSIRNKLKLTDETNRASINATITDCFGTPFTQTTYYWTCCENPNNMNVWTVKALSAGDHYSSARKSDRPVRAVKKITLTGGETADPKPQPKVTNIPAIKDAYYTDSNGSDYSGVLDYIYVQYHTGGDWRRSGYVQFDLSGLNADNVASATLNLTINTAKTSYPEGLANATFSLYKVSNEWEELAKTSTKQKGAYTTDSPKIGEVTLLPTDTQISVNISDVVKTCLKNNETAISVCIKSINSNNDLGTTKLYLYSRESTIADTQPYLQVATIE